MRDTGLSKRRHTDVTSSFHGEFGSSRISAITPVPLITSAEYNYLNTLRVFHFRANIEFRKRMERQCSKVILEVVFNRCMTGNGHYSPWKYPIN